MLGFIGNAIESISDAIGLPESIGDIAGGVAEVLTGNPIGAIEHGIDLFDDFTEDVFADSKKSSNNHPDVNDTDGWRKLMKEDPEAFAEAMKSLDTNIASLVTSNMQQAIQSENRTWSMMSNLQQAEHDTNKSIINNFRV